MAPKPISPFFEPNAPPPPLPLLTCQTDFSYARCSPTVTVAEETVDMKTTLLKRSIRKCNSSVARSPSPYVKPTNETKRQLAFANPATSSNDNARSELSDTSLSDLPDSADTRSQSSSMNTDDELIPKPDGEAGRPGRGGYNLEKALNWSPKAFRKLQKCVHKLVDDHLDVTKSYQPQKENLRQAVRDAAIDVFPQLSSYNGCWPVNDLMMLHLKNTSRRERLRMEKAKKETKKTSKRTKV